jgi:hypothetical protein
VTASYPASVKSFTTKVDFTDSVLAAHVNALQLEVVALQTELGTDVAVGSGWVGAPDFATSNWNTLKDRLANIEYILQDAYDARNPVGGTTGQVLVKNSSTNYDYSWTTFTGLPSQTSNTGYFLTTNGTSASWAAISQVPSQSTHSGKFLTTNGTTASWSTTETGSDNFTLMLMGA